MKYKFACEHCTGDGTVGEANKPTEIIPCQKCGMSMLCITKLSGKVKKKHSHPQAHDNIEKVDLGQRRVQRIRKSYYVNLPKTWIRSTHVKEGNMVEFSMDRKGILYVQKVTCGER